MVLWRQCVEEVKILKTILHTHKHILALVSLKKFSLLSNSLPTFFNNIFLWWRRARDRARISSTETRLWQHWRKKKVNVYAQKPRMSIWNAIKPILKYCTWEKSSYEEAKHIEKKNITWIEFVYETIFCNKRRSIEIENQLTMFICIFLHLVNSPSSDSCSPPIETIPSHRNDDEDGDDGSAELQKCPREDQIEK